MQELCEKCVHRDACEACKAKFVDNLVGRKRLWRNFLISCRNFTPIAKRDDNIVVPGQTVWVPNKKHHTIDKTQVACVVFGRDCEPQLVLDTDIDKEFSISDIDVFIFFSKEDALNAYPSYDN